MTDRRWFRRREAAEYMGVCLSTLDALMAERSLPFAKLSPKVVVLDRDDLDRWVERQKTPAVVIPVSRAR